MQENVFRVLRHFFGVPKGLIGEMIGRAGHASGAGLPQTSSQGFPQHTELVQFSSHPWTHGLIFSTSKIFILKITIILFIIINELSDGNLMAGDLNKRDECFQNIVIAIIILKLNLLICQGGQTLSSFPEGRNKRRSIIREQRQVLSKYLKLVL